MAVIKMSDVFLMSVGAKTVLSIDILSLLEMTDEAREAGEAYGLDAAVELSKEIVKVCIEVKEARPGSLWSKVRDQIRINLEADIRRQLLAPGRGDLDCLAEAHNALKRARSTIEDDYLQFVRPLHPPAPLAVDYDFRDEEDSEDQVLE